MIQRLNCPVCHRPAEVIFSRTYDLPQLQSMIARPGVAGWLAGKSYEVRRCPACDLHFQTWVMEENELANWYSLPLDPSFFRHEISKQKLYWFGHITEEILVFRQLCPEKLPVVLDFGCNWGKWASMALAHGCAVYGVEVNRDAAAFCAKRGINIVSREELNKLQFDFINVDQVVEHLTDPLGVARSLAAVLKPGGFMKLGTPDNPRLPRLLRAAQASGSHAVLDPRTIDSLCPLEHVNLFNHASLRSLGERVGLREGRLPFFKWMGAGQLWNLPRQFNRNLVTPWKRWRRKGPYVWLQRPA